MTPEERAKALEAGGFSANLQTGDQPRTGYMSGQFGSDAVTSNVATAAFVESHAEQHAHLLNDPETYQGGWKDAGKRYLDASKRFDRADEAHEFARRNAQIATYDLEADTDRLVHYGPAVKPRDVANPLVEHRAVTAKKNAAWRGTVRQHLTELGRNPTTQDEIRAAGERIGGAVYQAERLSDRIDQRG